MNNGKIISSECATDGFVDSRSGYVYLHLLPLVRYVKQTEVTVFTVVSILLLNYSYAKHKIFLLIINPPVKVQEFADNRGAHVLS